MPACKCLIRYILAIKKHTDTLTNMLMQLTKKNILLRRWHISLRLEILQRQISNTIFIVYMIDSLKS